MSVKQDLVAIGKIVGVFGINGEMKIAPMTHSLKRFIQGMTVWIGSDDTTENCRSIQKIRVKDSYILVLIEGIGTRTEAKRYVRYFLFVDRDHRIKLPPRTWFISDIIGMKVTDEQGMMIGIIADVLMLPAHHVYVVHRGKREVLIPAIPSVVQNVDLEQRMMVIHVPDGLLEI